MKNLFKLLAGIAYVIAILLAGSCTDQKNTKGDNYKPQGKVKIYIRLAQGDDGAKYLEMTNKKNTIWVKDSLLTTDVISSYRVKWKIWDNDIKEIVEINGTNGNIIKNKPYKSPYSKNFWLDLTDDLNELDEERYIIKFKIENDEDTYETDPILRVPPGDGDDTDQEGNGPF